MSFVIIGLAGAIGSGKTTAAAFIVQHAARLGFDIKPIALADPIRKILAQISDVSFDTLANMTQAEKNGPFQDDISVRQAMQLIGDLVNGEYLNPADFAPNWPDYWPSDQRARFRARILDVFESEWGYVEHCGVGPFVQIVEHEMSGGNVLVTDVRRGYEADLIRKYVGTVIQLQTSRNVNPNAPVSTTNHVSESLDLVCDELIDNDGSLDDLNNRLMSVLQKKTASIQQWQRLYCDPLMVIDPWISIPIAAAR